MWMGGQCPGTRQKRLAAANFGTFAAPMSTPTPRHTLGKPEKLKSRKLIQQLFASGKAFTAYPVKVVYLLQPATALLPEPETGRAGNTPEPTVPVQVGVSVSTRHFKHATDRNRIKRLLREAYRQQKHELVDAARQNGVQLSVFFLYLDKEMPHYDGLYDKMRYCLKRLRKGMSE
jgi:ribonuclease P protein component